MVGQVHLTVGLHCSHGNLGSTTHTFLSQVHIYNTCHTTLYPRAFTLPVPDNSRQLTLPMLGLSLNVTTMLCHNPSTQDSTLPAYRDLLLKDLTFLILSKHRSCTSSKDSIREWRCTHQGHRMKNLGGFSRITKGQLDPSSTLWELQTNG